MGKPRFRALSDRLEALKERVVNEIDDIVHHVRFEGWQTTSAGEG